jgi:hypothetical protein
MYKYGFLLMVCFYFEFVFLLFIHKFILVITAWGIIQISNES